MTTHRSIMSRIHGVRLENGDTVAFEVGADISDSEVYVEIVIRDSDYDRIATLSFGQDEMNDILAAFDAITHAICARDASTGGL